MWPFSKKINLPGFKRDSQGNLMFELTDEEKREIQKSFDMFKSPEGGLYVKKESADELQNGITARSLFLYCLKQIKQFELEPNKNKKEEFINNAIASISKAYSFCPLPIYIYDLACFMEMNGKINEAKDTFESFIELQNNFNPNQIQEILLNNPARDINEAIKDAQSKLS